LYKAKVVEVTARDSNAGNPMLEVVLEITQKGDFKGSKMWYYILTDGSQDGRLREFVEACGKRAKGTLDTDALEGTELQIKVKPDKDQYGDYRGAVGKVIGTGGGDEDEDEDDEPEEEPDEEDEDEEEEVDLDDLDRSELKKFIKDNELEISIKKSMSDDDIREAIAEASGSGEEDEDEDEEESSDDYDEWNVQELKDELKKRDISKTGKRADLIKALREDDEDEEPF